MQESQILLLPLQCFPEETIDRHLDQKHQLLTEQKNVKLLKITDFFLHFPITIKYLYALYKAYLNSIILNTFMFNT